MWRGEIYGEGTHVERGHTRRRDIWRRDTHGEETYYRVGTHGEGTYTEKGHITEWEYTYKWGYKQREDINIKWIIRIGITPIL